MATEKELKEREAAIEERERIQAEKDAASGLKKGEAVPAKYLKGLSYNDAKRDEVFDKKLGRKKVVHTPTERPLVAADVMSWADTGDLIIIATKDGQKYAVKK